MLARHSPLDGQDVLRAIIAPAVSLAGLLMVFVGFLLNRAEATGLPRRTDSLKRAAKWGLVPMALALLCAGLSVLAMTMSFNLQPVVVVLFEGALVITGAYAFYVLFRV